MPLRMGTLPAGQEVKRNNKKYNIVLKTSSNYSKIKDQKWDSDILGLIAAIYKEVGKQEMYLVLCQDLGTK